jgi:hypothetical protein
VRRTIIIGTAIAMLVGASAAFASFNSYSVSTKFSPNKAGSTKSPSPLGVTQVYDAFGTSPNRPAPLKDLKTTIYGLVSNAKYFPKCSKTTIETNEKLCPKGALVAQGTIHSVLGPGNNGLATTKTTVCDPGLDVWNAGAGKLWFFFTAKSALQCGGLQTGAAAPFAATVTQKGKTLVIDVPQPAYVSTKVANITNFYSSLIHEQLVFRKLTTTVKGKKVGFIASVACKGGTRPWAQSFTAVNFTGSAGGATSTSTVTGSDKCSK